MEGGRAFYRFNGCFLLNILYSKACCCAGKILVNYLVQRVNLVEIVLKKR